MLLRLIIFVPISCSWFYSAEKIFEHEKVTYLGLKHDLWWNIIYICHWSSKLNQWRWHELVLSFLLFSACIFEYLITKLHLFIYFCCCIYHETTCISILQSLKAQPNFRLWADLQVFPQHWHHLWSILHPDISSKLLCLVINSVLWSCSMVSRGLTIHSTILYHERYLWSMIRSFQSKRKRRTLLHKNFKCEQLMIGKMNNTICSVKTKVTVMLIDEY